MSALFNRIRILKTGIANVQDHLDMSSEENRLYFERLAEPGTVLQLRRVYDDETDPFRIEVYSPDGHYLGRVTLEKNETAARLMDAGLSVIAIVNSSMPVHDSDMPSALPLDAEIKSGGWSETARSATNYDHCNLPFCLYLVDD